MPLLEKLIIAIGNRDLSTIQNLLSDKDDEELLVILNTRNTEITPLTPAELIIKDCAPEFFITLFELFKEDKSRQKFLLQPRCIMVDDDLEGERPILNWLLYSYQANPQVHGETYFTQIPNIRAEYLLPLLTRHPSHVMHRFFFKDYANLLKLALKSLYQQHRSSMELPTEIFLFLVTILKFYDQGDFEITGSDFPKNYLSFRSRHRAEPDYIKDLMIVFQRNDAEIHWLLAVYGKLFGKNERATVQHLQLAIRQNHRSSIVLALDWLRESPNLARHFNKVELGLKLIQALLVNDNSPAAYFNLALLASEDVIKEFRALIPIHFNYHSQYEAALFLLYKMKQKPNFDAKRYDDMAIIEKIQKDLAKSPKKNSLTLQLLVSLVITTPFVGQRTPQQVCQENPEDCKKLLLQWDFLETSVRTSLLEICEFEEPLVQPEELAAGSHTSLTAMLMRHFSDSSLPGSPDSEINLSRVTLEEPAPDEENVLEPSASASMTSDITRHRARSIFNSNTISMLFMIPGVVGLILGFTYSNANESTQVQAYSRTLFLIVGLIDLMVFGSLLSHPICKNKSPRNPQPSEITATSIESMSSEIMPEAWRENEPREITFSPKG